MKAASSTGWNKVRTTRDPRLTTRPYTPWSYAAWTCAMAILVPSASSNFSKACTTKWRPLSRFEKGCTLHANGPPGPGPRTWAVKLQQTATSFRLMLPSPPFSLPLLPCGLDRKCQAYPSKVTAAYATCTGEPGVKLPSLLYLPQAAAAPKLYLSH